MIRINKKAKVINTILILDIIGAFFCIIKSFSLPRYSFWILPFIYTICLIFAQTNRKMTIKNMGSLILNITMSLRYVALPVIYYATNELSRFTKNYNNLENALWLMLYEMVVLMIVLEISARRYNYKDLSFTEVKNQTYLKLRYGTTISIIIFVIVLGLAVSYKNLAAGFNVILTGSLEQSINTVNNNILDILWETLSTWFYVYLIIQEGSKYERDQQSIHSTISIIYTFIFILLTFIQSVAFSRWYTIISAVAAIACLLKMFPHNRKKIVYSIIIPTILLLILITTYKNAGFVVGETKFTDSLTDIFSSSNFDSYFAGPVNVSNAIGVKGKYLNLGIHTFINDMFNNMPIINHYMDITKTTVYAFNAYIGRIWNGAGDQIMPLVGQSVIYFGYIFAPLMDTFVVLLMRKFDYLFSKSKSYMMYFYAFVAIWFSVEPMMLNFTINISWFYIRVIPFAIIFLLTDKMAYKQYVESGV